MNEFYIEDDGIKLHCKLEVPMESRQFPMVILLHGLTGHMEERHIVAIKNVMLKQNYGVLRVDLYGHGKSEGEFKNHTLTKWLNNVMKVTDYVKNMPCVTDIYLCGHSQGGLTTILAAGMRPNDYRAIIPLSPAVNIVIGSKIGEFLGYHFDPNHIKDTFIHYEREFSGDYLKVAQAIDLDAMIKKYTKPVLLVHGTKDSSVDVKYSYELLHQYENARLVIIEDDTHCYDYHLKKVEEAVEVFLKEMNV